MDSLNIFSQDYCLNNCLAVQQKIDPQTIVNYFLNEYYGNTMTSGWNLTMRLFDKNCKVMFRDKYIGNSYDLLTFLTSQSVSRAYYDSLKAKWTRINDANLLINIFGRIQYISYNGYGTQIMYFSETFIITGNLVNNIPTVSCTCHIIDF